MPYLPDVGIIVEQAPLTQTDISAQVAEVRQRHAEAIAEAEEYLAGQDLSPWEIAELGLPGKTRHAWFSEEFGFVYPSHPDAVLVLVIEIPAPDLPEPPAPVEVIPGA